MEESTLKLELGKFDIDAGVLCLDFCNTMDWHASDHPEELFEEYSDLVAWGVESGKVSLEEAKELLEYAMDHPQDAAGWLEQAIELRDALYRTFISISNQGDMQEVAPADLEILTKNWRQATQSLKITQGNGKLQWDWAFRAGNPGRVLWLVAQSAVELLESEQMDRIGQCQDDRGCGFLFLDTSRNRSRRWCSMESCGNRAKAHRHYAKARK